MKRFIIIGVMVLSCLMVTGCIDELEDLTDSAIDLMDEATEILSEIEEKAANGQLSEEVADMANDVVSNFVNELEGLLLVHEGLIFDRIDGSISNIFNNIEMLLDQIKDEILDESFPELLTTASFLLERQLSLAFSSAEELVSITAGSAIVIVERTTNAVVLIVSVGLLAIGLVAFAIIYLKIRKPITLPSKLALGFGVLYVVFFLIVVLIPPVRGILITSLGGTRTPLPGSEPSVRYLNPIEFTLGTDDRIMLFGRNLESVEDPAVRLLKGDNEILTFPKTLVNWANNQIVISGLTSEEMGWAPLSYDDYEEEVVEKLDRPDVILHLIERVRSIQPRGAWSPVLYRAPTLDDFMKSAIREGISDEEARSLDTNTRLFFSTAFRLEPGDYLIQMLSGEEPIRSAQHIQMSYPPPPVPRPDLAPLDARWTDKAVAGELATMRLRIGLAGADSIDDSFEVKVSPFDPQEAVKTQVVTVAEVHSRPRENFIDVLIPSFYPVISGDHRYQIFVDSRDTIDESSETNNNVDFTLPVGHYKYDVEISDLQLEVHKYDGSPAIVSLFVSRNGLNPGELAKDYETGPFGSRAIVRDCNYEDHIVLTTEATIKLLFGYTIQLAGDKTIWIDQTYVGERDEPRTKPWHMPAEDPFGDDAYTLRGTITVTGKVVQ